MKRKNKGFTLVEVLGIIIVIAIIATIIVPGILNVTLRSRQRIFATNSYNIYDIGKTYYTTDMLSKNDTEKKEFICQNGECVATDKNGQKSKLEIDSNVPDGKITIDPDGNISMQLSDGNFCSYKYASFNEIYTKEGSCEELDVDIVHDTTSPKITLDHVTKSSNHFIVNYDIVENESGVNDVICRYGESANNLDKTIADASITSCAMRNLPNSKKFYYEVCVIDKALNKSIPCLTGEVETSDKGYTE